MKTQIALKKETRSEIAQILNTVLADEHVLYTKARNYHWNVTGPQFAILHEVFEEQYNEIKVIADNVAERARMMGYPAIGTLASFLKHTRLEEAPSNKLSAMDMVADLLNSHEKMIRNLRADVDACLEEYEDEGTADLLIETMRAHEMAAWMLRVTLEE
ncbi:MAG: DNA starvation/stationary phase protection protein [Candidatus Promineifilaceae bacterium]|nr:DNA starvation/stationary phase protection protein [Candidatus Promineifilaceae bacterium]